LALLSGAFLNSTPDPNRCEVACASVRSSEPLGSLMLSDPTIEAADTGTSTPSSTIPVAPFQMLMPLSTTLPIPPTCTTLPDSNATTTPANFYTFKVAAEGLAVTVTKFSRLPYPAQWNVNLDSLEVVS
jgi:hypothetical protein